MPRPEIKYEVRTDSISFAIAAIRDLRFWLRPGDGRSIESSLRLLKTSVALPERNALGFFPACDGLSPNIECSSRSKPTESGLRDLLRSI